MIKVTFLPIGLLIVALFIIFAIFLMFFGGNIYDFFLFLYYIGEKGRADWTTAWPYFAAIFFVFSLLSIIELVEIIYVILEKFIVIHQMSLKGGLQEKTTKEEEKDEGR